MESPNGWQLHERYDVRIRHDLGVEVEIPQEYHIVPVPDVRVHDIGFDCWCRPEVQVHGPLPIIAHRALDGRTTPYRTEFKWPETKAKITKRP